MSKIETIVDKQVRAWSENTRSAIREGHAEAHWPIITISREFGARGAALADRLAKRTGFSSWNKQLVEAIAKDSKASQEIVNSLDERRRKSVEDAVLGALMGTKVTNVQYLRSLMHLVQTISYHGSAIIVGRGANYILRDDNALRVRVVSPLEIRVTGYASRHGIAEKEARRLVTGSDAERADFVRHQFRRNVTDAADYDIVLNSSVFDLDRMTHLVVEAYAAKFGRRPQPV